MIEHPVRAAEGLTLMLAAAFIVAGAFRFVVAIKEQFAGFGWVAINGVIAFVLGVAIWRHWPESSYKVIGLCVGIDLIFNGWSWVMLGLVVKAAGPATTGGAARKEVAAGMKSAGSGSH